ncbi:polysaccharide deacetylase family protein [Dactylosporangium vinaceum]|uniref:Polysaccharide deacetylase family protein n=1 Tax=Dactylosporangium vinaceum TaxID=53362 RepID=A0ABV5M6U4_9ACTN|nr:polysaccharide deacetylase family protein [Dactylosporangium vinaceum]UAB97953.1 polysaccharide deacetylase family protein [Dactylosporangium vinaceum]
MPTSVVNINVHGIGSAAACPRPLDPGEEHIWVSVEQFEQVLDAAMGRDDVRITFDDGNTSDVEIGLPRLLERGLKAHFFILAGELGAPGRLDRDDVRELLGAGMAVGSHGWAHRDWRRLTDAEAEQEMVDAPRVIGALTGEPVTTVAIPFGSYDRIVLNRLRKAGMRLVYSSDGGQAHTGQWLQARNSVNKDTDAEWIRNTLAGRATPAVQARRMVARRVKKLRGAP